MDAFSAIAEPNRRKILELIAASGELSSTEISKEFEIGMSAVSQHLKVLRSADLVKVERRAQQRIYSLNPNAPNGIEEMWEWLNKMRHFWSENFDRLDSALKANRRKK